MTRARSVVLSSVLALLACDSDAGSQAAVDARGVEPVPDVVVDVSQPDAPKPPAPDTAAPSCLAPGDYDETLEVDGVEHRFRLHIPPATSMADALVLQFHGGGSNGAAMELVSGLSALGDAEGFATLSPEGWQVPSVGSQVWNGGACCGPTQLQPSHVAATAAMLDVVPELGACFDAKRVYATGHSNGGIMTYRLACELSDRIAAVAVSAGYLASDNLDATPPQQVFACAPDRAVPLLHVHGLEDLCVPFAGGKSQSTGKTSPAVEDVVADWRARSACVEAGTDTTEGAVRRRGWTCEGGSSVELITVATLGHAWAGSPIYGNPELCGGLTTDQVSTTEEAWRFFQAHSLP